jgi:small subunit ribosomal protein S27Ae
MKKIEFFKVEGDKINRVRKYCPKCGPAIFLAEHKNRFSCGKCGYTEFKGGGKPKPQPAEEKPVEAPTEQPKEEPVELKEDQPKEEAPPAVEDEPKTEEPDQPAEEPPSEDKKD